VREASATLEQALENLPSVAAPEEPAHVAFKRSRIETLHRLAKVGETLLASLDAGAPVSADAIRAIADDSEDS
jgi:hypothetical protein